MVALVVFVSLFSLTPVLALMVNPASPIAGQPFTLTGPLKLGNVEVFTGSGCTGTVVVSMSTTTIVSYTVTVSGLPAGQYSVAVEGDSPSCVNFTVQSAPPIPEYPLGLLILAIFMVVTYGVIRRRTQNNLS